MNQQMINQYLAQLMAQQGGGQGQTFANGQPMRSQPEMNSLQQITGRGNMPPGGMMRPGFKLY